MVKKIFLYLLVCSFTLQIFSSALPDVQSDTPPHVVDTAQDTCLQPLKTQGSFALILPTGSHLELGNERRSGTDSGCGSSSLSSTTSSGLGVCEILANMNAGNNPAVNPHEPIHHHTSAHAARPFDDDDDDAPVVVAGSVQSAHANLRQQRENSRILTSRQTNHVLQAVFSEEDHAIVITAHQTKRPLTFPEFLRQRQSQRVASVASARPASSAAAARGSVPRSEQVAFQRSSKLSEEEKKEEVFAAQSHTKAPKQPQRSASSGAAVSGVVASVVSDIRRRPNPTRTDWRY